MAHKFVVGDVFVYANYPDIAHQIGMVGPRMQVASAICAPLWWRFTDLVAHDGPVTCFWCLSYKHGRV